MRWSIRLRTILVLNAFVIGLTVMLGWIAQDIAGRVVEERFVKQMVGSASGFLKDKGFPRSDTMMAYLRELFNAEWVACETPGGRIVGSSLPVPVTDEFRQRIGFLGGSGVIELGGQPYRVDSADLETEETRAGRPPGGRLYMLVPNAQFQEARRRAQAQVARVIWPAAGAATLLAILLSVSITRPIRKLAKNMDRLADTEGVMDAPLDRAAMTRAPKEISALASSFYRLLDRLTAARQRMAQSEQLAVLGKMCLSVGHELRNPLSGIKMNVRVLKDHAGLKNDPGIEAILREIDRMGLYLNELMSLSPGNDHPGRAVVPGPTKLSELADSVLTILAGRCRHARITVRREYPAEEPIVWADAGQIRQAMMNLMNNAIEAMPSGGTMTIALRPVSSGVRFSVGDTGHGVEADGKDIFEAFVSNKPDGVGLGLYISKQIIARHDGTIGYDSDGHGANFWFELPHRQGHREDASTRMACAGGAWS